MSSINRVGGGGAAQGPDGPRGPERSTRPGGAFASRLGPARATEATSPAAEDLAFPALGEKIREGLDSSLDRDGVLTLVVEDELGRAYGDDVPPEMVESVDRSFRSSEKLWSLFNRLYDLAAADRG